MRLSQLARKLGVTQNEINRILSDKGIEGPLTGNTKLEEKNVQLLYDHFGYKEEEHDEVEALTETEEVPAPPVLPSDEQLTDDTSSTNNTEADIQPIEEEVKKEPEPEQEPKVEVTAEEENKEAEKSEIEVIRAKKIKLEGIKVVGKIDLPEPPEKLQPEAETEGEENTEVKEKEPVRRKKTPARDNKERRGQNRNGSKRSKEEIYELKLKQKEKEAKRKKREREKKIKEKKKRFYEEQVKPVKQDKPKKKAAKKSTAPSTPPTRKKVKRHSNPIIRFWEWLNGKYD